MSLRTSDLQAAINPKRQNTRRDPQIADLLQAAQDAIITRLRASGETSDLLTQAKHAAKDALDNLRDKPNKIGRARIFGDKTIGMDDPRMVAVLRLLSLMRT